MTSARSMCKAGQSKLLVWDNPERWGGEGCGDMMGGTHVHPWLIHVDVWQKLQYCKVIILQLK